MKLFVRAGLAGVAAAAAAVGIAEVIAVGTGPLSAPLLAVGGVVVDNVPPAVKDFGVAVFGVHDKTALITGTAILLAAYAFGLGVVARRWWRWGLAGIALFAVIGVAAAVTRHDAGVLAALPTLIGAAIAVPLLRYLLGLAVGEPVAPAREPVRLGAAQVTSSGLLVGDSPATAAGGNGTSPGRGTGTELSASGARAAVAGGGPGLAYSNESRRRFLKAVGITAAVAVVTGVGGRLLTSRKAVTAARQAVVLPTPVSPAPTLPAGVQVPGVTPYVSPNDDFTGSTRRSIRRRSIPRPGS